MRSGIVNPEHGFHSMDSLGFTLKSSVLRGLWPGRGNSCKSSKIPRSAQWWVSSEIVTRLNALLMRLPFFSDYLRGLHLHTFYNFLIVLQTSHFVDLRHKSLRYRLCPIRLLPQTGRRNWKKTLEVFNFIGALIWVFSAIERFKCRRSCQSIWL